jgi:hypothetical protein
MGSDDRATQCNVDIGYRFDGDNTGWGGDNALGLMLRIGGNMLIRMDLLFLA